MNIVLTATGFVFFLYGYYELRKEGISIKAGFPYWTGIQLATIGITI